MWIEPVTAGITDAHGERGELLGLRLTLPWLFPDGRVPGCELRRTRAERSRLDQPPLGRAGRRAAHGNPKPDGVHHA